jgi:hypothetical protein
VDVKLLVNRPEVYNFKRMHHPSPPRQFQVDLKYKNKLVGLGL